MNEAMPSLLDPTELLRSQHFRTDQDSQLVEVAESYVDPLHSRCRKHSKNGLCDWHKVSFYGLTLCRLLTI